MVDALRKLLPGHGDVSLLNGRILKSSIRTFAYTINDLLNRVALCVSLLQDEIARLAVKFEDDLLANAKAFKAAGKSGIVILPGVQRLLAEIRSNGLAAERHYAICTSGEALPWQYITLRMTNRDSSRDDMVVSLRLSASFKIASRAFASEALATAGINPPTALLTADDCSNGKPHPEPYQKGAALLNTAPSRCIVIEDAPAGIASGLAAGAVTIAVCTSHTRKQLENTGATHIVDNLEQVHVEWDGNQMNVLIDH